MITVHFVYPSGPSISCPDAIGRKLGELLSERYRVLHYAWEDSRSITPRDNDVLLGHPHPFFWTVFRRSARHQGWRRVLALSPFAADPPQVAFFDSVLPRCDLYLAITGNFWIESLSHGPFTHWIPKMIHVDLAIDRNDFPPIKTSFNSAGRRSFVYIGHSGWQKNPRYLGEIARRMPTSNFSWIGSGRRPIEGFDRHGFQDFSDSHARDLVRSHDFLITAGSADANPASILESMAWGLIPVCTPQSGYVGFEGIVNIPLDDPETAVGILERLQQLPESQLRIMQQRNWDLLDTHFTWERVATQVVNAIESDVSPSLDEEPLTKRILLRSAGWTSPYSPIGLNSLRLLARRLKPHAENP